MKLTEKQLKEIIKEELLKEAMSTKQIANTLRKIAQKQARGAMDPEKIRRILDKLADMLDPEGSIKDIVGSDSDELE